MKFIFEIKDQETLHHFYLVKSPVFDVVPIKNHFTEIFSSEFELFDFNYDNLLVDQAREIIDLANRKIGDSKKSLFFIKANSINSQAQNSLLKSLEEPTKGLHFFFVLPELNNILPTVLSRALVVFEEAEAQKIVDAKFLEISVAEKIKYLEKLAAEIKDGKKTKQDALNFVDSLIEVLNANSDFKKEFSQKFATILELRSFISDNGASVKSILEAIVLALPTK
jgi:DNA polymerase III gamma/tau subunit